MTKHSINIQDGFLFQHLKEGTLLSVELMTGGTILGKLKRFDRFAIVIDEEGCEKLIYKHAIVWIANQPPELPEP